MPIPISEKRDEKERGVHMTTEQYIAQAEQDLLHTYNRYPVVLDKGEGVVLTDIDGKEYLDFSAGIAVFALGYNNAQFNEAVKNQVDKLIHTSNYYYNVPAINAAAKIKKASGMDRVFFTNSGTEAIEGAIKTARRYAYDKDGCTDHEIIAMEHSFHGRSMGSLAVTGTKKYREPFEPLIGGVKFAQFNDLESVKKLVNEKTCAIILEPVQGEGGIYPATKEFMQGIRQICDENDILMICDEIQCGMGRTGTMYAYLQYGVMPDVVTTAKALGCGVPVGAFLTNEKSASLVPGDHGTTYGGNPLVTAAVDKVFDIFEQDNILDNVKEMGAYLEEQLEKLMGKFDCIKARRGIGLMQGLEFTIPVGEIAKKALDTGLILITAGTNVIRFVPPLVIRKEHIDHMIEILSQCIEACEA